MPETPFLFGAQYYRAPTPEPACWERDMAHMRDLGFNAVKLWVQWRWTHRTPDTFIFDDVDRLMDLAQANNLRVTINTIFDVAPSWLYRVHPDARQVTPRGTVESRALMHRQLGGHPGPCYNHAGAREERQRFLAETVRHYGGHPALQMWDIWNEPEQSFPSRQADPNTVVCYCPSCLAGFTEWLRGKYATVERLNEVWGRCYTGWEDVEAPLDPSTITDYVDWREFHLDTMSAEAKWRLAAVHAHDPGRTAYLHVVPNTMMVFGAVTAVDDFALAEDCDVFCATMNGIPDFTTQVVSAARGKRVYNVESHVNYGSIRAHQRILTPLELQRDLLPQVGLGVRGFLFWQFRSEVLGTESPAWGLVGLDGQERPVTRAARDLWATLRPHADALLACPPAPPTVGLWKSRRNEIAHFCMDLTLANLAESVSAYVDALYWQSYPFRVISEAMLERGEMEGVKLLVMPAPMYLTQAEARALDAWLREGGTLLTEAHLAAYSGTTGRHARRLPGGDLADSWDLREVDTTSVAHLEASATAGASAPAAATDDERKAAGTFGVAGGQFVPFTLEDGTTVWGGSRWAQLAGGSHEVVGRFADGGPALVRCPVGNGAVYYCATHPGMGARQSPAGLRALVAMAARGARADAALGAQGGDGTVHVDLLAEEDRPRFVLVYSRSDAPQTVRLHLPGDVTGLFTGTRWAKGAAEVEVPARFVDLFTVE